MISFNMSLASRSTVLHAQSREYIHYLEKLHVESDSVSMEAVLHVVGMKQLQNQRQSPHFSSKTLLR